MIELEKFTRKRERVGTLKNSGGRVLEKLEIDGKS